MMLERPREEHSARSELFIHSDHPLVFWIVKKTLGSLPCDIRPFSQIQLDSIGQERWVLILDAHSVKEWLRIATQCHSQRGRPIVILTDALSSKEEELKLLYLGVQGIVPMANIETELVPAVDSVMNGHLWLRRSTLDEYVKRTAHRSGQSCLTMREEQVVGLLARGLGNKEIADALSLSDRTVKFHVSNVLRKLNAKNRKDLLNWKSPAKVSPVGQIVESQSDISSTYPFIGK